MIAPASKARAAAPRQFFTYNALDLIRSFALELTRIAVEVATLVDDTEANPHWSGKPYLGGFKQARAQILLERTNVTAERVFGAAQSIAGLCRTRRGKEVSEQEGRYLPAGTVGQINHHLDKAYSGRILLHDVGHALKGSFVPDAADATQEAYATAARLILTAAAEILSATAASQPGDSIRRLQGWERQGVRRGIAKARKVGAQ